jgi:hypothetical protein
MRAAFGWDNECIYIVLACPVERDLRCEVSTQMLGRVIIRPQPQQHFPSSVPRYSSNQIIRCDTTTDIGRKEV